MVKPDTEQLVVVVVQVKPSGVLETTYLLIGGPPFNNGAFQLTVTLPSFGWRTRLVGAANGTMAGTMADEGEDAALEPMALVAMTVKV